MSARVFSARPFHRKGLKGSGGQRPHPRPITSKTLALII